MWVLRQLFVPFSYLLVRQNELSFFQSRALFEVIAPLIIGLLFSFLYLIGFRPTLIGAGGLFSSISDLCQLLAAFFLAALAAVATFSNENLDKGVRGGKATIKQWSNEMQRNVEIEISRRAYLTRMLGFLAWLALVQFVVISIFESMEGFVFLSSVIAVNLINSILFGLGVAVFLNMWIVTASAIIFFISRLNSDEVE
jgi:hypothetical protein